MPYTIVKGHYIKRNGKKIWIPKHKMRFVSSQEQGRSGSRFKKLQMEVANEYMRRGYSRTKAMEIGKAVAGKVFWRKYGKSSGRRILKREK